MNGLEYDIQFTTETVEDFKLWVEDVTDEHQAQTFLDPVPATRVDWGEIYCTLTERTSDNGSVTNTREQKNESLSTVT